MDSLRMLRRIWLVCVLALTALTSLASGDLSVSSPVEGSVFEILLSAGQLESDEGDKLSADRGIDRKCRTDPIGQETFDLPGICRHGNCMAAGRQRTTSKDHCRLTGMISRLAQPFRT